MSEFVVTESKAMNEATSETEKTPEAPWRWIREAFGVYQRQAVLAAGYGLSFVVVGYALLWFLSSQQLMSVLPVAVGGFALAGPLLAAGLYAIAKADEEGRKATFSEVLLPDAASPGQIAYLGVLIVVAMGFWTIIAAALLVTMGDRDASSLMEFASFALSTGQGISMVIVGSLIGGAIAAGIFSVCAFSIPFLFDQESDFATAIARSIAAVKAQPTTMALWAWIIAMAVAFSGATLLVGFVVLFPLLGFATWIGYRDVFGE
ncbi:MAG: DUF2189 domain-containing protein [Pseudomonadota bacterium]